MAISHTGHDHPNTPAGRAACRKAMKGTVVESAVLTGKSQGGPKITVVPRRRGDGGVVKGMQATAPKAAVTRLKVSGSKIATVGDLADVPAVLAVAVRHAWGRDWIVQAGHPFNDVERRIVIAGLVAEIALVWDEDGRTAFFVRNWNSSLTHRVTSWNEAFRRAESADMWDDHGNMR